MILDHAKGRTVLHIGMGGFLHDQTMTETFIKNDIDASLHAKLSKTARALTGIDINETTIDAMRRAVPNSDYVFADVTAERLPEALAGRRFELIVFADVIEHLDNFRQAISNLKSLLADGGEIIITSANAFSIDAFAKMLFHYESAHEEHTCYFSWLTIKRLLQMNDLRMTDFRFYTRFDVKRFDGVLHRVSYTISKNLSRLFPQYAMGVLAVAMLK